MSIAKQSDADAFAYEGCVAAGRATGKPIPPPSDEDLRRAEEAWNDPAFYESWKDEGFVGAGWVPKPIVDPNRTLVPSETDIAKLPRWARVAFAARCARRVFPLLQRDNPNAIDDLRMARNAIAITESAATSARTIRSGAKIAEVIFDSCDIDEGFASAAHAVRAVGGHDSSDAHAAVLASVACLCRGLCIQSVGLLAAPARDFDQLLKLAEREKWTDDTPVPPSVFGPMWEGSSPEWWTEEPHAELSLSNAESNFAPKDDTVAPH